MSHQIVEACLGWLPLIVSIAVFAFTAHVLFKRLQFVASNEQLLLHNITEKAVINGPAIHFPSYLSTLSFEKRPAVTLSALEYCIVKDSSNGSLKTISGPKSFFLGETEAVDKGPLNATVLSSTQGIVVKDSSTGLQRLVKGPCTYTPSEFETVSQTVSAISMGQHQYARVSSTLDGSLRVERGPQILWLEPNEKLQGRVRSAFSLNKHQQIRLRDKLKGSTRVLRGERLVFPDAHEEPLVGNEADTESCVESAIDLAPYEYTRVQDQATGVVRVERGQQLLFLGEDERIVGPEKESAVVVDTEHAVLLRNRNTGVLSLVEEPQLFVPSADEEVVEVRPLISLADHEAMCLRDSQGSLVIRFGNPNKDTPRAFFIPPAWSMVKHIWSRGRRRERRDLEITVFDLRPSFMSFEFNCRTSDNVEMILEGTFFWQIIDIAAMLKFTGDAPGDVCAHARSCFIALISKVTLAQFMENFNDIAKAAHSDDDCFYSSRGLKIHSLEVTRYACADQSTATILEQIIQETTNRMNRLSIQESENEVSLAKLRGAVEQENTKGALLEIQRKHAIETATAEGLADAERCVAFLQRVKESAGELAGDKLAEELWSQLRKSEAIKEVARGNATVYFTPQDANLTIENRNAAASSGKAA